MKPLVENVDKAEDQIVGRTVMRKERQTGMIGLMDVNTDRRTDRPTDEVTGRETGKQIHRHENQGKPTQTAYNIQ